MDVPEVRYARSGSIRIAYSVFGHGEVDIVYGRTAISQLELVWEEPTVAEFFSRLGEFSRVILWDKRGVGLSDRVAGNPTLEDRMDDVGAVIDAVGPQRAALFGVSEGGPMSLLFAATYPERTSALVLYGSYARHPTIGADNIEQHLEVIDRAWGTGEYLARFMAPQGTYDEGARRRLAHAERQSASP